MSVNKPAIDDLCKKVDCRYTLVVESAKRARELVSGSQPLIDPKDKKPVSIAVERDQGHVSVRHTFIHGTKAMQEADYRYLERYMKFLLWSIGGFKVSICGCSEIAKRIQNAYSATGERAFDVDFFKKLYERDLEILDLPLDACPAANESPKPIGGHVDGCRIGFDAGGSDIKVAAVINGETVWAEEIVWLPKLAEDISYHHEHIKSAMLKAAEHMPSFDAVGISTAGVLVANRAMVSHLFLKVPKDTQGEACKNVYVDVLEELGVPYAVANDGDVAALAASMDLDVNGVLGIAMGTSQAGGYVDINGNVTGWHNELAFVPVDYNPDSAVDEWSGDYGCGVKYFSTLK